MGKPPHPALRRLVAPIQHQPRRMVGVFNDAEFRRIRDLPRRPQAWNPQEEAENVELVTAWLKTPGGTMKLKPIQARALVEAADHGDVVLEVGAGAGKTLCSFLLFTVWEAKRGVLFVPAHLLKQTLDEHVKLSKHWRLLPLVGPEDVAPSGPHVRLVSYSSLSLVRYASFLEEFEPDVVIADEAQSLANTKSARGKRVFRYFRNAGKAGRKVRFVPMSGTMRRKRLGECSHLYAAALDYGSPIPAEHNVLRQWSAALDEGVKDYDRVEPGALLELCTPAERAEGLSGVRSAFRRRLIDTPGVIATSEASVDVPLVMKVRDIDVPGVVRDAFALLRAENKLPNGDQFDGGLAAWQHARELANGFGYICDPPAPIDWLAARADWNAFVLDALGRPSLRLDSPLMVWNAVEAGKFGPTPCWERWRTIRHQFKSNPKPLWISDFMVRDAEKWALETGGIVWVGFSSAFLVNPEPEADDDIGRMFTRIPYFGGGPKGDAIRHHRGPCVASIRSHGTGKNLTQWNQALMMSYPSSGTVLEQLLARHQRLGQEADEVEFNFYCHSLEAFNAVQTSRSEAIYQTEINGSPQRVLGAVVLDSDGHSFSPEKYEAKIAAKDDPMWTKSGK